MNLSLFSVVDFCRTQCSASTPVMLDIGANRGVMSFYAIGKGFDVVAFEPVIHFYQLLRKKKILLYIESMLRHKNGRFVPFKYALSDNVGSGTLFMHDKRSGGHSIIKGKVLCTGSSTEKGNTVPFMTLDCFMAKHYPYTNPRINLIKIDAEGAEHLILRGARKTIEAYRPLVFTECRGANSQGLDNFKEIYTFFMQIGYHAYPKDKLSGNFRHTDILFSPKKLDCIESFKKKITRLSRKDKIVRILQRLFTFRFSRLTLDSIRKDPQVME